MKDAITRRNFVGGMGAAALAASVAMATGCTGANKNEPDPANSINEKQAVTTNSGMSDEEALEALRTESEVVNDLVLEDGTIIPALYVRMRNRSNRLGAGLGSNTDTSANYWAFVMRAFSEKEAEYYLEMPLTKTFTAAEFSATSGRDEASCLEVCEALASRGLLYRVRRGGVAMFRLIPQINGMWEYSINEWYEGSDQGDKDYLDAHWSQMASDYGPGSMDSDIPPFFRTLPISSEVVGDERIMSPFDDFESIIRRNSVIARGDCICRANNELYDQDCDHPKQTEILTGEEAEYYIENGIGWPISQDEALEVLHDAVDRGLVIQTTFSKASEIFCCCAGDCCKMLGTVKALGGGEGMKYYSHYNLQYDKDTCIACGTCVGRCHLEAITIGDDGRPQTGPTCVRCGQCVVTCPAQARTLVQNEDYPELPDTLDDSYLHKAITRVKRGYVTDVVPEA